jgi:hypothetical protein
VTQPWFELVGGQCRPGMVMLCLRYEGPEAIVDGWVTASGEHITDVAAAGMISMTLRLV